MEETITKVDPALFKEMKTDQGVTVDELCQKGVKVLLYFLNSLGCQFCQGRIDDLYNLYDSLIKLNVVPIILYNEETEDYKNWVKNNTRYDSFDVFYSMKQGKFSKLFDIQPINLSLTFSKLHYFAEKLRLQLAGFLTINYYKKKVTPQLATAFIIYDNKIVSEYRPATPDERFDFTKIIIDPENFGISVSSTILECAYVPKKKQQKIIEKKEEKIEEIGQQKLEHKKSEKTLEKKKGFFESMFSPRSEIKKEEKEEKELEVKDILGNEQYRKYFKVHLTKEFSVENLIFWEEVQLYKKVKEEERLERIEKMITTFFNENSIYEVNTSKKYISEIIEKKESIDIDIFQKVENEVYESCFFDAFIRFKNSDAYPEMLSTKKKPKTSYLL